MASNKRMNAIVNDTSRALGHMRRTANSRVWPYRFDFNAGKLVPVYARKVEPNQNITLKGDTFIRSITPLGPVMDNAYEDIFFFYVPSRLLWDHFEDYITGQGGKPYNKGVTYTKPKIKFKSYSAEEVTESPISASDFSYSFLDYLPQAFDPVGYEKLIGAGYIDSDDKASMDQDLSYISIDALFPRAYVKIYNDWFRPEFLEEPLELYTGDNDEYADEFAFNLLDPDALLNASKLHNLFTDATPEPSMGADVLIPMDDLEVGASLGFDTSGGSYIANGSSDEGFYPMEISDELGSDTSRVIARNVSNTIRMLNVAYKTQILLDKDANFGTRYEESIRSHFDLRLSNVRASKAEYLGWRRIGMNTYQITNTAESSSSALGNVGGQSTITDAGAHFFSHAFPEHGVVLGVAVLRTNFSISGGIHPQYQEFDRFDEHWPEFNHIGRIPLYSRQLEINSASSGLMDTVFGYVPYREYERTSYGLNAGKFRSRISGGYSYLTYQEDYSDDNIPVLSDEWIKQGDEVVKNTLIDQVGTSFYGFIKFYEENTLLLDPTSTMTLRM